VRWQHPERGLVGPDEFIGVASETWLILAIGAHVILEACRQAKEWRDRRPEIGPITVWVNLSMRQLCHPDLVATVRFALAETGVDPAAVGFEIPESGLMEDPEAAMSVLQDLARLGVGLGIDDFAAGNSSLTYLSRFPVGRVKIDRTLVADLGGESDKGPVVHNIVGVAHLLGLEVVAGGLETQAELGQVRRFGCDVAQGWLFARAAPADELTDLLTGPPLTG
jgi:EAL domain-containing protein (putative c-di-GMP-specific phosphodiesterase class I)